MKDYQKVPLSAVAEFVRGITFKPEDVLAPNTIEEQHTNTVNVFRTKNVQEALDLTDVWELPENFIKRPDQILKQGDILVSSANSWNLVGKCSWVPKLLKPSTFGGFISALRVSRSDVCPRYVYRWFNSPPIQQKVRGCARQTTNIANLDFSRALSIQLPLPPLPEQRRIAAVLDQADALRRKRRDTLEHWDRLAKATFLSTFGDPITNPKHWPKQKAEQLCERITVGIVVKPASYYRASGVPAIRGTNIKPTGIDLSDCVFFSEEDNSSRLSKTRVREGDIVLVRSGRPGLAAVVPGSLDGANAIDVLIATPDRQKVLPRFLRDLINSAGGKRIVLSESRGQVQQHFNVGSLSQAELIVPPVELQATYEHKLDELERAAEISRAALTQLDTLFASLQHRAFRGEL